MRQLATRFYQSLLLMALVLGAAGPTLARENPKDFTLPSTLDYSKAPAVKSFSDLSPSALHVASLLNIDKDLRDLDSQAKSADRDRLNLLILKQNLTEAILSQSFEIRATIGKVDTEIADSDDLQALLEERRDKALRLNSIANFVSGGITGIVGGSLNLGDVNSKVDDSMELGDGIVQAGLALYALKQQSGEKHTVKGLPNMLGRLLSDKPNAEYSPVIWKFINEVPTGQIDTQTRRDILLAHWRKLGLIDRSRRDMAGEKERAKAIAGMTTQARVSIDLLDARSAMLHDLKATVSELDSYLLELIQYLRSVKI